MLSHLPGGAKKGAKGGATKRASHADALDSCRGELSETQGNALQTHHDVHGPIHGAETAAMSALLVRPGAYRTSAPAS